MTNRKRDLIISLVLILISIMLLLPFALRGKSKPFQDNKTVIDAEPSIYSVALLSFGNIAKKFHTEVQLDWDQNKDPKEIIYGNKDFGYFSLKDFSLTNKLSFSILPFTFEKAINFCIKYQDGTIKKGISKKFNDPQFSFLKNIRIKKEGKFSQNFFLMSAQFVPEAASHKDRSYLPVIVNRNGEIIWAHLPNNGKTLFQKYPTIKPLGNGDYGIIFGEKYSYFERFNILGKVKEQIFPKMAVDPYVIHHDFIYLGQSKILTLGHKVHYVRNLFSFTDKSLERVPILSRPKSFLSTTVELVDISTNKNKTMWDPISLINPLEGVPWSRNKEHAERVLQSPGRHFTLWGKERAKIDWTHANSIEHYPGVGILVSMRNMSQVVLLDENSFDVIWTLGNRANDTYQTLNEKHAFYHQHHVQLLENGYILMLDNHTSPPAPKNIGSRVSIYGVNQQTGKAQIVWNYQPQNKIHIGNRGSAYMLENKNVLAFYPVSVGLTDNLIEIERKTGQPVAHLKIYFTDVKRNFSDRQLKQLKQKKMAPLRHIREGGGNRVVPIHVLGKEKRVPAISCGGLP